MMDERRVGQERMRDENIHYDWLDRSIKVNDMIGVCCIPLSFFNMHQEGNLFVHVSESILGTEYSLPV